MIVQCPNCDARYRVNATAVPATGGRITCPSCQHIFIVYPEREPLSSLQSSGPSDADKTSVTQRPDLQQLVQRMRQQEEDEPDTTVLTDMMAGETEVVSSEDLTEADNLRAQIIDDGTVEMRNPLLFAEAFLDDTQHIGADNLSGAFETEVLDDDDLEDMELVHDTAVMEPEVGRDIKLPGRSPGPALTDRPRVTLPNVSSRAKTEASRPGPRREEERVRSAPRLPRPGPGAPDHSGLFADAPARRPRPAADRSGSFPARGAQPARGTIRGASARATEPREPAPDTQRMSPRAQRPKPPAPAEEPLFPAPSRPERRPEARPEPSGPDPAHDGPWKLKTEFGLVYEFSDTTSLLNWLVGRDALDSYQLAGAADFYPLMNWPQLEQDRRIGGRKSTILGIGAVDISAGAPPPRTNTPAPTPTPAPAPPPEDSAPKPAPELGSWDSAIPQDPFQPAHPIPGHTPPAPAKVAPAPQSSAAEGSTHWFLWPVAGVLFAVVVILAVDVFEIYDVRGALFDKSSKDAPFAPPAGDLQAPPSAEASAEEQLAAEASDPERAVTKEVDRMITDAREAIADNRLRSANMRLNNAKLLSPDRVEIYELLEDVFEKMGSTEQADAARQKAEELRAAGEESSADEEDEPADEPAGTQ